MVFCKQWGHYHQERIWAKIQRHTSTSSDEDIKTMLLTKFVIISKIQWCFVNNGGMIFRSSFKRVDFWNLKRHVLQCHINRAVKFNSKLFYPGKLKHMELVKNHCARLSLTIGSKSSLKIMLPLFTKHH